MRLFKGLSATVFVVTAGACITQLGTLPIQDDQEDTKKSQPDDVVGNKDANEPAKNDCGYQEIIVDNPDKTKTIVIIPLECEDPLIEEICDPQENKPDIDNQIYQLESSQL